MNRIPALAVILLLFTPGPMTAQGLGRLFPPRSTMPELLAGPRDPATSATLLGVLRNPDAHGRGTELEVAIGSTLPILLLAGKPEEAPVVIGLEAAAFARFGLQLLEREMVATDWIFAVPVTWHHQRGWTRVRFYHTSSHMGDEYSRRFGDPGINFSRDAAEILLFRTLRDVVGAWTGIRYGYNVHPQEDERWVFRTGGQFEGTRGSGTLLPFLAIDTEWDQAAGMRPRAEIRFGARLPAIGNRRSIKLALVALTGPTPLGQFRFRRTTQIGLTLTGSL